jgi:tetratricopeptide (TPR) repeat protein
MVVSCLTVAILLGSPPALQEKEADVAALVQQAIEKMSSDDWEIRGQGEEALKELGAQAIPHIKRILAEKGDTLKRKEDVQEILEEMEGDIAQAAIKKLFPEEGAPGTFPGQTKPVLTELGEDAERLLTIILKTSYRESTVRTLAAAALGELGKPSALPALEAVLKDEWESDDLKLAVAQAMDRLGKPEPFDTFLKKAEALHAEKPEDLRVMIHLAGLYRHRNDLEKTEAIWRKLLALDGESVTAHYNLACTLAVAGKTEDALTALETAVAKGYKSVQWMEMDGDLASIRAEDRYKALVKKLKGE